LTDASQELIASLFAALQSNTDLTNALGGTKIFDKLPERVAYPYVVIGRTSASDWSTATEDGAAITFFIHCWSETGQRSEVATLQQLIDSAIGSDLPPMEDHTLIHLRRQITEVQRDYARGLVHGLMRYRAVLEPKVAP
jgi:hypothetical protein